MAPGIRLASFLSEESRTKVCNAEFSTALALSQSKIENLRNFVFFTMATQLLKCVRDHLSTGASLQQGRRIVESPNPDINGMRLRLSGY